MWIILVDLMKEHSSDFIRLVLHSIPHTPETIESDLSTFHQDTQTDNLISSLPTYETSQQKLAGVLIELVTWDQVRAQVWAQVGDQVGDQVRDQVKIKPALKECDVAVADRARSDGA